MFLKLLSTLGKSNLTKKSARNVSLLVYYYKHESPSRLDFLSFPNNRQCNVKIKIFQRVRANKYEPFNWSIETLHDVVCDMRYQMLDYFLRLSFFFFFPPPTPTIWEWAMTNEYLLLSKPEHRRDASTSWCNCFLSYYSGWLSLQTRRNCWPT